jgi:hypothetical protein
MLVETKKVEKHGKKVWSNAFMDELRKTECLCLNCARLEKGVMKRCLTADILFGVCKKNGLALMVTRCPKFKQKQNGD